jgi:hypothetical protein
MSSNIFFSITNNTNKYIIVTCSECLSNNFFNHQAIKCNNIFSFPNKKREFILKIEYKLETLFEKFLDLFK